MKIFKKILAFTIMISLPVIFFIGVFGTVIDMNEKLEDYLFSFLITVIFMKFIKKEFKEFKNQPKEDENKKEV